MGRSGAISSRRKALGRWSCCSNRRADLSYRDLFLSFSAARSRREQMWQVKRLRMLKKLLVSELRARKPPGKWQVGHGTAARALTEVFSALRADALRCWTRCMD